MAVVELGLDFVDFYTTDRLVIRKLMNNLSFKRFLEGVKGLLIIFLF
jgi:hypothetical protein